MARLLFRAEAEIRVLRDVLDRMILSLFPKGPHPMMAIAGSPDTTHTEGECLPRNPLQDLVGDGFLWGVPKSRRSRERRLTRKFGSENFHKKILPLRKLLTCDECGHVHEPGRLCPNCYEKNKQITTAMQEAMNSMQGMNPIEHEAMPVFAGEKVNSKDGFFEGKRIFEVPHERPRWFSRRLTTKSNVTISSDTTVAKPTNLA